MDRLLEDAAARSIRYLEGLDGRPVTPGRAAVDRLRHLEEPFPAGPMAPEAVLARLDEHLSPATMATAGPRYFGFVTGGVFPVALAANWLAGAWDQMAFSSINSPAAAALERIAIRWLLEALALPAESGGVLVTGATMANFTALAAARDAVLARVGWDVEADGLFGAPPIAVIVGDEVHASLIKALGMLGLGRERVVRVPVDAQGRMRAAALPSISGPTVVCIQAGNVNTGAFDPAAEICARAHASGAWVHVDGAFGLWAAAAPERAPLAQGVAAADSWATDAHKWLNVPYDCGAAFVRDASLLHAAMSPQRAAYLPGLERQEHGYYGPEMSRRARAIEVWATLQALGRAGLADLIERTCRHAARFAEGLRSAGYAVLNEVQLNQVLVSFGGDDATRRVIAGVQEDGTCWCGGTVWQGRTAMRISVSSWATTEADVERSLEAILRMASAVQGDGVLPARDST